MKKKEKIPVAKYGSLDSPLRLGENIEISCYVLDDGTRALVQRGMVAALDMKYGGNPEGTDRLSRFVNGKAISSYISNDLRELIENPIRFKTTSGVAHGYPATVLADLCDAVLSARQDGKLQQQQLHIAKQCELLMRGWARVGIIALVDEATGYQDVRARDALHKILDEFISKELQKWAKTFPDEFYKEMFRLRGWGYSPMTVKKPSAVGKYTNDLVYDRLAPGVLEELKKKNPVTDKGYRKTRHHQWLTADIGHPRLREHIASVITLMKASNRWDQFYRMMNKVFPRFGKNLEMDFEDK